MRKTAIQYLCAVLILVPVTSIAQQVAQPVVMALPVGMDGKDPLTTYMENKTVQAAATAINQVLTERKMEVRDLKQQVANFDRLRMNMSSVQEDPNALIAANVGADVYLEFGMELVEQGPTKKARVDINVKEAVTAKLLGASSGQSDAMVTQDLSSLFQIAVNNCIETIMGQIRGYWSEVPTRGKPIILTVSSPSIELNRPLPNGVRIDRELTRLLKENAITYRKDVGTSQTFIFNPVYVDYIKYDDVAEFGYLIEDLMEEKGITNYRTEYTGKSVELILE